VKRHHDCKGTTFFEVREVKVVKEVKEAEEV
jgi:hypothetical protein